MYSQSYIDKVINSTPTWGTCVDLEAISPSIELSRVMGGLSSAIRSGSEVTHIDWGQDWIEYSVQYLEEMSPLKELSESKRYEELDEWLEANEKRIIHMIHKVYVNKIRNNAQQGNTPDRGPLGRSG